MSNKPATPIHPDLRNALATLREGAASIKEALPHPPPGQRLAPWSFWGVLANDVGVRQSPERQQMVAKWIFEKHHLATRAGAVWPPTPIFQAIPTVPQPWDGKK